MKVWAHNDADHAARLRSILPTHAGFVALFPEAGEQYRPHYEKRYQFLIDNVDTLGEREIKIRPDIEWEYEYRNVRLNESDVITYNETMAYIAPGTAVYEVTAYTDHRIEMRGTGQRQLEILPMPDRYWSDFLRLSQQRQ